MPLVRRLQQTFWGWIWPVVEQGSTRQLNAEDLPALPRMMYLDPQVQAIDAAMETSCFGTQLPVGLHF